MVARHTLDLQAYGLKGFIGDRSIGLVIDAQDLLRVLLLRPAQITLLHGCLPSRVDDDRRGIDSSLLQNRLATCAGGVVTENSDQRHLGFQDAKDAGDAGRSTQSLFAPRGAQDWYGRLRTDPV